MTTSGRIAAPALCRGKHDRRLPLGTQLACAPSLSQQPFQEHLPALRRSASGGPQPGPPQRVGTPAVSTTVMPRRDGACMPGKHRPHRPPRVQARAASQTRRKYHEAMSGKGFCCAGIGGGILLHTRTASDPRATRKKGGGATLHPATRSGNRPRSLTHRFRGNRGNRRGTRARALR
jgi:hypothetical protein